MLKKIILMLSCMAGLSAAANPMICGSKPIRLAFFDFGYFYYEINGQAYGVDKDLVDELAKATGCKFVTQVMPRARIFADLESGDLDMSVTGIVTPERERFLWFIPYIATRNVSILQRGEASLALDESTFLKKSTLQFGVVRGFKHGEEKDEFLDRMRQTGRLEESANISLLFEKLKLGRIDGLFSSPPVYRKFLKDLGIENQVVVRDWYPGSPKVLAAIMLTKARFSEADAARWREVVQKFRRDGTLEKIFRKYMPLEAKDLVNF